MHRNNLRPHLPLLVALAIFTTSHSIAREIHVSPDGSDSATGTQSAPLQTISQAAAAAQPGDTVTVHKGTYREWVNPIRGGVSDEKRIVYRAAPGERVVIKGSEEISGWKKVKNGVWMVVLPNAFFSDYNPYADELTGDWLDKKRIAHHTGEVFLNGKSLFEDRKSVV